MNFSVSMASAALVSLSCLFPAFSRASTSVAVDSWLLKYAADACINDAIRAANQVGFTINQEVIKYGPRNQNRILYASSIDGPYSMAFACEESDGTVGLAVSGLNNGMTFQMYQAVLKAYESL